MPKRDDLAGRLFVPGERKHFEPGRFSTLENGSTWYMDSGLGGVYQVSFCGLTKVLNRDSEQFFTFRKEALHRQLFDIVADSEAA